MTIKYRYSQEGEAHEGEMQRTTHMAGSHEVVRVVQQTANDTGEIVRFSMLNPTGTAVVGSDHAEPKGVDNTGLRTVETVDISADGGESWHSIHIRL